MVSRCCNSHNTDSTCVLLPQAVPEGPLGPLYIWSQSVAPCPLFPRSFFGVLVFPESFQAPRSWTAGPIHIYTHTLYTIYMYIYIIYISIYIIYMWVFIYIIYMWVCVCVYIYISLKTNHALSCQIWYLHLNSNPALKFRWSILSYV